MKRLLLLASLAPFLAAPLAAQDPAPPPPAPEPEAPAPEQEPVTQEMLLEAIGKVRASFDRADETVQTAVERVADGAMARSEAMTPATEAVDTLIADMQALLDLLPDPPS